MWPAAVPILTVSWARVGPHTRPQIRQAFQAMPIYQEDPSLGRPEAAVTIVTLGSFTCPACKRNIDVLQQVQERNSDKVRLVWKDLPEDDTARQLALAARCAQNQGKFWPFLRALVAQPESVSDWPVVLPNIAGNLGLNRELFTTCLQDQQPLDLLERSIAEATAAHITAVPYSEVNGTIRVDGELSFGEWQAIIEQ